MQSTKPILLIALGFMLSAGQYAAAADSQPVAIDHAKTVDDLLSAETGQLSAKAHPLVEVKHAVVASASPSEALEVEGVWGITGEKHALVTLDGVPSTVGVGDPVGRFRVASIAAGCVDLQALKGLGRAKRAVTSRPRHGSSVPPFGGAAEIEHRKACFHEQAAGAAPVGLMPPLGTTRAASLPLLPPVVSVPANGQLAPVQLPH